MNREEHEFQCETISLLRRALPESATCWSVFNEAKRSHRLAETLKRGGLTAGVADVHILWSGYFITLELKTKNTKTSKQSPDQICWEENVLRAGGIYRVVRNIDEVLHTINQVRAMIAKNARNEITARGRTVTGEAMNHVA